MPASLRRGLDAAVDPHPYDVASGAAALSAKLASTHAGATGAVAVGAKIGGALAALVALGVGGVMWWGGGEVEGPPTSTTRRRVEAERTQAAPTVAPPVVTAPLPPPPVAAPIEELPRAVDRGQGTGAGQGARGAGDEIRLIAAATAALDGDPRRALALTEQARRRYPRGVLAEERDALAVFASARLGRREDAGRRARAFLLRHPAATARERVEAIARTGVDPRAPAP